MSLTYQQIWERYSQVEFRRRLYVKRLQEDGTYENNYTEVAQGLLRDGSITRLQRSLPNNSWQFGKVIVGNARLNILSPFQEFAGEGNPNSIFSGFLRHRSILKVEDSLIDRYTDTTNPEEINVVTFVGLIDSATATTEQGYETLTVLDFISVLDEISVNDLSLVQTTLNALVYEIMNRSEFTKFFNVSNSASYINAGINITSIDVSQYSGSVLEMLEDLSKGHSIFYVDLDDNYFYFKAFTPTSSVQYEFLEQNNRKLSVSSYREGVDRQITNWYWNDSTEYAIKEPAPINPRIENLEINGVTNSGQRQAVLEHILTLTQDAKPYFQVKLPYFPIIKLLDRVIVQSFGQAPPNAARWGMVFWTSSSTTNPATAPRFHKPAGIRVSSDEEWMVRSIVHDKDLITTLELEKIL